MSQGDFRKRLQGRLPTLEQVKASRGVHLLGSRLHDPELWHLTRRSTALAVGVGVFLAFAPVPFQMLLAALAAIIMRINVAVTIVCVWITNPLTMAPIYYGCYRLGSQLLGQTPQPMRMEWSWQWLMNSLGQNWQPLLLGTTLTATVCGLLGFMSVRLLWRLHLVRRWQSRARRRAGDPRQS